MYLRNALILLVLIVSYAHGQNSNISVTADISSVPLPTPPPVPANTTFRGRAFYEDDKTPVRRSVILFFNLEEKIESSTLTDEKGVFELKNVKAATYYPIVLAPGAINFFSSIDFSKINENERLAFADAAKSTSAFKADGKTDLEVEISVKRGGAISGKATYADGSPAIGSPVQVFRKVDGKLQPVISDFTRLFVAASLSNSSFQTDDKGMYRFAGLPAGEYYISVSEPAFHTKNSNVFPFRGPDYVMSLLFGGSSFLNTFFPNTIEIKDAQPLKVELGKERTDANITIPDWKLFNISGKIISAKDGKPVKARVYAVEKDPPIVKMPSPSYNSKSSRAYSQTDENGNWEFTNIPRGRYTILVEPLDENYENAVVRAAEAANAAANTAAAVVAETVANAANSAEVISNTASNRAVNTSNNNKIKTIPKQRYAKTSYEIIVENSDVENVSIKTELEAVIKGSAEFDVQSQLEGVVRLEIYNEANVIVGRETLYLYNSDKHLGKIWKQDFDINYLPKGKLKMKIIAASGNVVLKSATFNGLDLQQNSFEINAGQTLDNFKLIFGTKKP